MDGATCLFTTGQQNLVVLSGSVLAVSLHVALPHPVPWTPRAALQELWTWLCIAPDCKQKPLDGVIKRTFQAEHTGTYLLIPVRRRQRQADLSELEASLVYIVSYRTVRAASRDLVSKNKTKQCPTVLTVVSELLNPK